MGNESKPMITLLRDHDNIGNFIIKNDTFVKDLNPAEVPADQTDYN